MHEPFLKNLPKGVIIIIAINVAIMLLLALMSEIGRAETIWSWAFVPARYTMAQWVGDTGWLIGKFKNLVTPFSYTFLHASWEHLAVNMLWLLPFGVVVNRWSTSAFFGLFALGGLGAAVAHFALYPHSLAPLIGASGAVSGLMGAAIRIIPSRHSPFWGSKPIGESLLGTSGMFTLFYLLFNVVGWLSGWAQNVSWEGHIGGFLLGFLATSLWSRKVPLLP